VWPRRARAERHWLFDAVGDLLGNAAARPGHDYPVLTGDYRGHPVRLEPLVDGLAMRTLPSLWLLATQYRRLPVDAPLDVLARPTGTEFYSPNATYAHELAAPEGYPTSVRIATPDPRTAPVSILPTLRSLAEDRRTKEILVSAGGVRVVHKLAEAAQGPYRSTRRARFGEVRIAPAGLAELLDALTEIGDRLACPAGRPA
jgi:hypothetical protein